MMRLGMLLLNNPFGLMFLGLLMLAFGGFVTYRGFASPPPAYAWHKFGGHVVRATLEDGPGLIAQGHQACDLEVQKNDGSVVKYRVAGEGADVAAAARLKPGDPVEVAETYFATELTSNGHYIVDQVRPFVARAVREHQRKPLYGVIVMLAGLGGLVLGWRWFRRYTAQHWK